MLDVLILTHNEELNLPHALASVQGLAAQVFVLDSNSTDQTAAIAAAAGAAIYPHAWEGYAAQKNWALDNLPFTSPWILILDADESLTPGLAEEIREVVGRDPGHVRESAFYLNRVLIFMGHPIRHCGYFPSWNIRLFKRGSARYERRAVHEHMLVDGPTGHLRGLMRHEDRRGLEHYIAKHNRYSTLEARDLYRQDEPWPGLRRFFTDRVARRRFMKYRLATKIATPWVWRFFYMYVLRGGFLDRQAGLSFCLFISSYDLFIRMKYQDMVWTPPAPSVGSNGGYRAARFAAAERAGGLAIPEGVLHPTLATTASPGPQAGAANRPSIAPAPARWSGGNGGAGSGADNVPAPRRAIPPRPATATNGGRDRSRGNSMMRQNSPWTLKEKAARVAWGLVEASAFRLSPHNAYGWRRFLLSLFGARVGKGVRVRRTAQIQIPWHLAIGDHSIIGDHAILYCLGAVTIGRFVTISQYAHLCAGTHETHTRRMELLRPPITVGDDVWVAADAFVGPGVTIGARTILGARASAFRDLPPDVIAVGNPASAIGRRDFAAEEIPESAQ